MTSAELFAKTAREAALWRGGTIANHDMGMEMLAGIRDVRFENDQFLVDVALPEGGDDTWMVTLPYASIREQDDGSLVFSGSYVGTFFMHKPDPDTKALRHNPLSALRRIGRTLIPLPSRPGTPTPAYRP